MQDAIGSQVNAFVSNKAIPIGDQAGVLFHGIWPFEVFIYCGRDRVDRGENIS